MSSCKMARQRLLLGGAQQTQLPPWFPSAVTCNGDGGRRPSKGPRTPFHLQMPGHIAEGRGALQVCMTRMPFAGKPCICETITLRSLCFQEDELGTQIMSQKQPQLNQRLPQDRDFCEVSVVSKAFVTTPLEDDCPCELALTRSYSGWSSDQTTDEGHSSCDQRTLPRVLDGCLHFPLLSDGAEQPHDVIHHDGHLVEPQRKHFKGRVLMSVRVSARKCYSGWSSEEQSSCRERSSAVRGTDGTSPVVGSLSRTKPGSI